MEGQRFLQDARHILANSSNFIVENNCLIWTGASVKKAHSLSYGVAYIKPPEGKRKKSYYVHRLALFIENNIFTTPRHLEVSHLCHRSLCIQANHLSLEPHHVNNNRIHCKMFKYCTGHPPYRDCILI